ncbi:hypothetical protein Tsubulata_028775 [Turnera subulata]|uniref:Endosulphine n=1 Tax=Turnera subulata TaxID=218843 RepID=A0A9Q0GBN9_9ROSI|nr:hypothetical protein Tsubulata_028775 [Turnera subulata]
MSNANVGDIKAQEFGDDKVTDQVQGEHTSENQNKDDTAENPMPTPQQEEETIKKKYGGILPKKKPLISKDHERAFFDSADWALGKQGAQKPKGPLEALRPKLQFFMLQPTHQQARSRRSAYAPADGGDDDGQEHASGEDENCKNDDEKDKTGTAEDLSSRG